MPSIHSFELGPFATNCYVVAVGDQCWIVDASFEPGEMIDFVKERELRPAALILTHAHVDHIAGVAEVRRAFAGIPIWMHKAEAEWLTDPVLNLSAMMGLSVTAPLADRFIGEGDVLELGRTRWEVRETPGHSPGGITLYCAGGGVALVGDSLFAGSIGRTDFPGSDFETLARSIRTRLYTLPKETAVYPGHGPATTVGREMVSNPFVRQQ